MRDLPPLERCLGTSPSQAANPSVLETGTITDIGYKHRRRHWLDPFDLADKRPQLLRVRHVHAAELGVAIVARTNGASMTTI